MKIHDIIAPLVILAIFVHFAACHESKKLRGVDIDDEDERELKKVPEGFDEGPRKLEEVPEGFEERLEGFDKDIRELEEVAETNTCSLNEDIVDCDTSVRSCADFGSIDSCTVNCIDSCNSIVFTNSTTACQGSDSCRSAHFRQSKAYCHGGSSCVYASFFNSAVSCRFIGSTGDSCRSANWRQCNCCLNSGSTNCPGGFPHYVPLCVDPQTNSTDKFCSSTFLRRTCKDWGNPICVGDEIASETSPPPIHPASTCSVQEDIVDCDTSVRSCADLGSIDSCTVNCIDSCNSIVFTNSTTACQGSDSCRSAHFRQSKAYCRGGSSCVYASFFNSAVSCRFIGSTGDSCHSANWRQCNCCLNSGSTNCPGGFPHYVPLCVDPLTNSTDKFCSSTFLGRTCKDWGNPVCSSATAAPSPTQSLSVQDDSSPPPKRKRNQDVFKNAVPWVDSNGVSSFQLGQELDAALLEIGRHQFQGNGFNGVNWIPKRWEQRKKTKDEWRLYYCSYHYVSKCQFRICVIKDMEGKCQIFFPTQHCEHSDHSISFQKRGVAKQAKAVLYSPSHLDVQPKHYVQKVRQKGIAVDENESKKLSRAFARLRKKNKTEHLPAGPGNTWGNALQVIESLKRENIVEFMEHTSYILDSWVDNEKEEFLAVMSTENLLLNAYRQLKSGHDLTFGIDTSHHYTTDEIGLMPIKVIGFNQQSHTVAYGIVSSEDADVHEFIIAAVRVGVEDVVNKRIDQGHTHV